MINIKTKNLIEYNTTTEKEYIKKYDSKYYICTKIFNPVYYRPNGKLKGGTKKNICLKNLKKNQLLNIIQKMKKDDLLKIIKDYNL